ncbi:MAG: monovalent cation/H(+) antiporter subunit G [Spirochaetales bacterium]|nr:monovalent cation/H(+) antiporter subunit G [Spirochaetales bacterium]
MVIAGQLLILIGSIFLFLGALGIIRMPDVFNRLQAGTKATTLGALSLIIGVGLIHTEFLWKAIVLALFVVLTNPISSSTIARASYKLKVPMFRGTVIKTEEDFLANSGQPESQPTDRSENSVSVDAVSKESEK